MLDKLKNIFSPSKTHNAISKDAIAELLKVSPEALEEFEAAYAKTALQAEPETFFETNSRQAAAKHSLPASGLDAASCEADALEALEDRIVDELLAQTKLYVYDGKNARLEPIVKALPEAAVPVQNSDLANIPMGLRPQLAGNLMQVDISEPSYIQLLWNYKEFLDAKDPKRKQLAYHQFRQGLDILDLDSITYEILGTNPNTMGHWLPKLVDACIGQDFFKIPATVVAKVPIALLQLTRLDYESLTLTTFRIVNKWAYKAFGLKDDKDYFIKTGTFSSKFDFRNCRVTTDKEIRELGEYLLYINHQAVMMAGPLTQPSIYGVSTTNEWVVREFIPDAEGNPCIYKGLPLHTEYRIFIDCDTNEVIGISPYWEPETMKKRFEEGSENSPHHFHDYVIYKKHEDVLMSRYNENKDRVIDAVKKILPALDLKGQWSLDIMQNGTDFWLIDMAIAENSAFYDCVPKHLRRRSKEDWIPKLLGGDS